MKEKLVLTLEEPYLDEDEENFFFNLVELEDRYSEELNYSSIYKLRHFSTGVYLSSLEYDFERGENNNKNNNNNGNNSNFQGVSAK